MQTLIHSRKARPRSGFSLIEVVVVVLLIGIIAATAAPRMFDTTATARVNTARQSLAVVRDAIELHRAQLSVYPGGAGTGAALANDLKQWLKAPFPKVQISGAPGDGSVSYETDGNGVGAPDGTTDWLYDTIDGTIIINLSGYETY